MDRYDKQFIAMKKVVIDIYSAKNRNVGVGEYSFRLGESLAKRAETFSKEDVRLQFLVPKELKGCFGDGVDYIAVNKLNRYFYRYLYIGCSLFHAVHQFAFVRFMLGAKRSLLTLHDVNFMYEKQGAKLLKYKKKIGRRINFYDEIVYISKFVEQDVMRVYPENNVPSNVIYNGVADTSQNYKCDEVLPFDDGFLLHLSSLQPKKNPELLIRMMQYLPSERLVIVGNWSSAYGEYLRGVIKELDLKNVVAMQHVSDSVKATLYKKCKAFLFPSLCEGFGLPPIEAMHFGKPVFLSTLTSLPEVGGELAYYWAELEPKAMAESFEKGIAHWQSAGSVPDVKAWASKFSWDACADAYMQLYLRLLSKK